MTIETLVPKPKPYEVRDDKLVGFTVRISRGGARTFWLRYPFGGKRSNRHRIGTYPNVSVDEARALAKAAAGDVARGINPAERKKSERIKSENDRLVILRTYLDERFEPYALSEMKSGSEQLRRIRSDFADRLDKPMTTLSDFWADGLRRRWQADGLTNKTINRDFQRIEAVLAHAVKWGVLKEHPLAKISPLDEDEGGRVRFLSSAEEKSLREALIKREDKMRADRDSFNAKVARNRELPQLDGEFVDHLRPLVLLAMNTGMRRGEIFSLLWSRVDLQAETIEVKAATSKSGQTRRLPANAEVIKILTAWRNQTGGGDGYVFPGVPGKKEKNKTKHGWRLTNINRSWEGVVKSAGLVDFNFHDLRHHFASRMVQRGVDLNTVRVLLGHKDIKTTLIYAHLAPDNLRAAVAHLAVAS